MSLFGDSPRLVMQDAYSIAQHSEPSCRPHRHQTPQQQYRSDVPQTSFKPSTLDFDLDLLGVDDSMLLDDSLLSLLIPSPANTCMKRCHKRAHSVESVGEPSVTDAVALTPESNPVTDVEGTHSATLPGGGGLGNEGNSDDSTTLLQDLMSLLIGLDDSTSSNSSPSRSIQQLEQLGTSPNRELSVCDSSDTKKATFCEARFSTHVAALDFPSPVSHPETYENDNADENDIRLISNDIAPGTGSTALAFENLEDIGGYEESLVRTRHLANAISAPATSTSNSLQRMFPELMDLVASPDTAGNSVDPASFDIPNISDLLGPILNSSITTMGLGTCPSKANQLERSEVSNAVSQKDSPPIFLQNTYATTINSGATPFIPADLPASTSPWVAFEGILTPSTSPLRRDIDVLSGSKTFAEGTGTEVVSPAAEMDRAMPSSVTKEISTSAAEKSAKTRCVTTATDAHFPGHVAAVTSPFMCASQPACDYGLGNVSKQHKIVNSRSDHYSENLHSSAMLSSAKQLAKRSRTETANDGRNHVKPKRSWRSADAVLLGPVGPVSIAPRPPGLQHLKSTDARQISTSQTSSGAAVPSKSPPLMFPTRTLAACSHHGSRLTQTHPYNYGSNRPRSTTTAAPNVCYPTTSFTLNQTAPDSDTGRPLYGLERTTIPKPPHLMTSFPTFPISSADPSPISSVSPLSASSTDTTSLLIFQCPIESSLSRPSLFLTPSPVEASLGPSLDKFITCSMIPSASSAAETKSLASKSPNEEHSMIAADIQSASQRIAAAAPSMDNSSSPHMRSEPETSTPGASTFIMEGTRGLGIVYPSDSGFGTRRYGCTICNKRFSRPSTLRTHMNSHTGERPYACIARGCGWKFTVLSNLKRHFKVCAKYKLDVEEGLLPLEMNRYLYKQQEQLEEEEKRVAEMPEIERWAKEQEVVLERELMEQAVQLQTQQQLPHITPKTCSLDAFKEEERRMNTVYEASDFTKRAW
ncbi:hypothetical protein HK102_004337 [Quaeritorhiza haematococci]|nr:hypothetical protein HK102_004337 [Quaeritorhiza haematococci]